MGNEKIDAAKRDKVKKWPCSGCELVFISSQKYYKHRRSVHKIGKEISSYSCSECSYKTDEKFKLLRHSRTHSGERPYQCDMCSLSFANSFGLTRHKRVHSGEKPYECSICHVSFSQKNILNDHSLTHTPGQKRFKCEFCQASFNRKRDFDHHVKDFHTCLDSPIPCDLCSQEFSDKYSYRCHKKAHKGPLRSYKCHLCPYKTDTSDVLDEHLEFHISGVSELSCGACKLVFETQFHFDKHKHSFCIKSKSGDGENREPVQTASVTNENTDKNLVNEDAAAKFKRPSSSSSFNFVPPKVSRTPDMKRKRLETLIASFSEMD